MALAGLDTVAAAVRRPPRPAPDDRLRAVRRADLAVVSDQAEAAARQWREGFSIVRRSGHDSRIREDSSEDARSFTSVTTETASRLAMAIPLGQLTGVGSESGQVACFQN